jgi:type IV pilus assembly protein PilY1
VYVGGNDGMLHAFSADVTGSDGGKELFAVVPDAMFLGPDNLPMASGLRALSDPSYLHHYYVDGTPFVRDIDFARAGGQVSGDAGNSDWRTLLVFGLGKGGKSYVAVDVTSIGSEDSETTIAGKVLWEFNHPDLGYTFGRPMIGKTRKWGWVVIVAGGYNNNSLSASDTHRGKAVLFVLNPKNGALLQEIVTSAGSAAGPAGLAHVSGYVPDYSDMTIDQVYGGDLLGNFWRFDFTSSTSGVPTPSGPFARLLAAGGSPQPVTTEPLIEIASDLSRYVFVGTGKLLHADDRVNSQQQTFYGFRDGTVTKPYGMGGYDLPEGASLPVSREQMKKVTSLVDGVTQAGGEPMGWYYDLSGVMGNMTEQVVLHPQANEGVVSWVGNQMSTDKCDSTGESSAYAVKYGTAKSVFGSNANGARVPVNKVKTSSSLAGASLVRYGSTIRVLGTFSNPDSPPAFVGSQIGGFGDPRVVNWRLVGQ